MSKRDFSKQKWANGHCVYPFDIIDGKVAFTAKPKRQKHPNHELVVTPNGTAERVVFVSYVHLCADNKVRIIHAVAVPWKMAHQLRDERATNWTRTIELEK